MMKIIIFGNLWGALPMGGTAYGGALPNVRSHSDQQTAVTVTTNSYQ